MLRKNRILRRASIHHEKEASISPRYPSWPGVYGRSERWFQSVEEKPLELPSGVMLMQFTRESVYNTVKTGGDCYISKIITMPDVLFGLEQNRK